MTMTPPRSSQSNSNPFKSSPSNGSSSSSSSMALTMIAGLALCVCVTNLFTSHNVSLQHGGDGFMNNSNNKEMEALLRKAAESAEKAASAAQAATKSAEKAAATATSLANANARNSRLGSGSTSSGVQVSSTASTASSTHTASSSLEELETFLRNHPDTPGARFVKLLRQYLFHSPTAERDRLEACDKQNLQRDKVRDQNDLVYCMTGKDPNQDSSTTDLKTAMMPMPDKINLTGYEMPRYPNMDDRDRIMPILGTTQSCLPMVLAGASLSSTSVMLELGPYFGFSSKCFVAGLRATGVREGAYYAFDTFEGGDNYNSILHNRAWFKDEFPFYNEDNPSFLKVWEMGVQPIYPTAKGIPGFIDKTSVTREKYVPADRTLEMLSIDSAKNYKALRVQLEGIGKIQVGTIVFLQDFELAASQVKLVFGCLRPEGYLLPVYTAWCEKENWAFVALKEFAFGDDDVRACWDKLAKSRGEEYIDLAFQYMSQDVAMLTSLKDDPSFLSPMDEQVTCLKASLMKKWHKNRYD